jgi:hypothetical protein
MTKPTTAASGPEGNAHGVAEAQRPPLEPAEPADVREQQQRILDDLAQRKTTGQPSALLQNASRP